MNRDLGLQRSRPGFLRSRCRSEGSCVRIGPGDDGAAGDIDRDRRGHHARSSRRRTLAVLVGDLYAVAALAGAGLVVVGHLLSWPVVPTATAAAVVCFGLRVTAMQRGWTLPVARAAHNTNDCDQE